MSVDAIYDNFTSPAESIKLWRRDWDAMPEEALVRLHDPDINTYACVIGSRDDEGEVYHDYGASWVPVGWYWLPNANSDAAYGDPGEEIGG